MKKISKLTRLGNYLAAFAIRIPEDEGCPMSLKSIMTTAQADATSKLAHRSDVQILCARPEYRRYGDTDTFRESLNTVIFVLEKCLAQDKTEDAENEQYDRLATIADAVLDKINGDATAGNCSALSGLDIVSVDIVPESSIFGGWCGYSIEISFE